LPSRPHQQTVVEVGVVGMPLDVAAIVTTNLAFSEWTQVIPNAPLCKAPLDRITDSAHILDTGTESYRVRRTLAKGKKGEKPAEAK
jgi:hypothetical protein